MEHIKEELGRNLKRIRQERGLSLDKIAALTGVSKAMLGQIERGESNPTVTTLWKIANGLRISFSSLISTERPSVAVIKKSAVDSIEENDGKYKVYPIVPFDTEKKFEIHLVKLEPGGTHHSEPHHAGVEEYLFVTDGTLEMEVGGAHYTVQTDETIIFDGNQEHVYINGGSQPVKCVVMIYYA